MIVTVVSFKGGVGKTTTAIHLAAYLQTQADTLLIDADPNRSALGWAKRGQLPFPVIDEWQPVQSSQSYQHVVIDTQARPIVADLAILAESCDRLIVPTTPDIMALDALALTLECLQEVQAPHYRILVTLIPPKPSRDGEQAFELLNDAHLPVFPTGIRRAAAFQKAARMGVPVYALKEAKAQEAWEDYTDVGKVLLADFLHEHP
jgi:chromosome partitioning protein